MSKQDIFQELFEKFLHDKKMTPGEIRQLRALVQDEHNRALLDQMLASLYEEETREPVAAESNARAAFEEVWAKLNTAAPATSADPVVMYARPRRKWWMYAAAAILVLSFASGAYWLFLRKDAAPIVQQKTELPADIQPGSNKARLVLADGSIIILDTAANGTLLQQGGVVVTKKADGQLAYEAKALTTNNSPLTFNTLATPRGGRYTLTLPDGSKVWLNAASSIRYPTTFTGKERKVEITGEAYFEVEKNAAMPFLVTVDGMQVEVLGTHFNIMAYGDEQAIKTTLLEGKVKVTAAIGSQLAAQSSKLLAPGQQAIIASPSSESNKSSKIMVQTADTEAAIAWKNDLVQFEGHDIHAAMRMIARWYDVEVEYKGNIPNAHFRGTIASNVPVSQVLDMMEKTEEVHFEVRGRKIIVTP